MPELVITRCGRWTKYETLVEVSKETDSRIYGKPVNKYGYFGKFCSKDSVVARNATPEMFAALREEENRHKDHVREVEAQMKQQFDERCAKIIAEHGGC